MANALIDILETRDWLLLDGATGTNLFAMGLMSGYPPEFWNVEAPEKVRALHDGFIEAGSDLFLTNSFGGTSFRLKLHQAQNRVRELNLAAAEIARECADKSGRKVIVAGSVGPTGEVFAPLGELLYEDAVDAFEEQISALLEGGVDVIWAETIFAENELRALEEATRRQNAPFCITLSFDTAGRTMMGITSVQFAEIARTLENPPIGIGANCGTGASDLLRTVMGITEATPDRLVIAKANAGIPELIDGEIKYNGTPELMADYACLVRDAGARLIGGCCGTTPAHVRSMRDALETRAPGPRPTLDQIREKLGDFSSASDGTGDDAGANDRSRGRRRRRA